VAVECGAQPKTSPAHAPPRPTPAAPAGQSNGTTPAADAGQPDDVDPAGDAGQLDDVPADAAQVTKDAGQDETVTIDLTADLDEGLDADSGRAVSAKR